MYDPNEVYFNDCAYLFPAVTVQFQGNSYSVKEGDGICIPLKASGNLNRDFEVTLNLRTQFAAGWLRCVHSVCIAYCQLLILYMAQIT